MKKMEIIKYRRQFCQFILLMCVVFFMTYASLSGVKEVTEETEGSFKQTDTFLELKNGQFVEQEFDFLKDENIITDKIGIACKSNQQNPGSLQAQFSQHGQVVQTEEIALSESGSFVHYDFELDSGQFSEDKVSLKLGYSSPVSNAVISVLSEAAQDGKLSIHSPALKITYRISELSKTASRVKGIMSVCLPVLLTAAVFLFCFTKREGLMRGFLFGSIFCIISLRYYFLILNCQPFAEELNVYINSALQYGFPRNLLVKDAGYLAVLQHAVTWGCVCLFRFAGMKTVSLAMNVAAVMAAAFCCTFPVGKIPERVLPRSVTFGLSAAIPTILVRQYESFLFLNFIYFAILLYIALLFMDFSTIKKGTYILYLLLTGILILSKGFFVVLFPASVIGILFHDKGDRRRIYWHLVIMVSSLCQLGIYFLGNTRDTASPLQFSFTDDIPGLIEIIGEILTGIFIPYLPFSTVGNICAGMIYIFAAGSVSVLLYRRGAFSELCLFLQIIITLSGSIFLAVLGTSSMQESGTLFFSRQEFIGIIMMIVSLGTAAGMLDAKDKSRMIFRYGCGVYVILCSMILSLQTAAIKDKFWINSPNTDAFSTKFSQCCADYDIYADYIRRDSFYIPSCPDYWCYDGNCDIYLYSCSENPSFWRTDRTYTVRSAKQLLEDRQYTGFEPAELTGRTCGLTEVFVSKTSLQHQYEILCYDKEGNLVGSAGQLNDKHKWNIGYIFDEPLDQVYTVEFVNAKTREPVTVRPEVVFVYAAE